MNKILLTLPFMVISFPDFPITLGFNIGLQYTRNGYAKETLGALLSYLKDKGLEETIRKIKEFKEEQSKYKEITLSFVFIDFEEDKEPIIRSVNLLTGKRMHTQEILNSMNLEAKVLRDYCGLSFPIMQMMHEDEETKENQQLIAVNQFYSTLYYFTV